MLYLLKLLCSRKYNFRKTWENHAMPCSPGPTSLGQVSPEAHSLEGPQTFHLVCGPGILPRRNVATGSNAIWGSGVFLWWQCSHQQLPPSLHCHCRPWHWECGEQTALQETEPVWLIYCCWFCASWMNVCKCAGSINFRMKIDWSWFVCQVPEIDFGMFYCWVWFCVQARGTPKKLNHKNYLEPTWGLQFGPSWIRLNLSRAGLHWYAPLSAA